MTYQPRHAAAPEGTRDLVRALDPARFVDFWRALQDNTPSRLGSRVMLRQAREPDLQSLHPTEAP